MQREVMLPRILTTYNNLNSYSEQLFESIFAAYQGQFGPPLPIKYIFDFLDEQAERISQERPNNQDLNQSNLSHIWKSNCLPLRFWVNLIKVFDINSLMFNNFNNLRIRISCLISKNQQQSTIHSPQ